MKICRPRRERKNNVGLFVLDFTFLISCQRQSQIDCHSHQHKSQWISNAMKFNPKKRRVVFGGFEIRINPNNEYQHEFGEKFNHANKIQQCYIEFFTAFINHRTDKSD